MLLALPETVATAWVKHGAAGYVTATGLVLTPLDRYLFRSDGRWTTREGTLFLHSDGQATRLDGDTYRHQDGSWTRRTGSLVVSSTGRRCTISNDRLLCSGSVGAQHLDRVQP